MGYRWLKKMTFNEWLIKRCPNAFENLKGFALNRMIREFEKVHGRPAI